ncbi:37S ribosomal protein S23, mitochondrial [[Candida] jaroonii]|uniref:37S ribosomal protein S23, mitochondrial n=1 Tax=[Candida] jaroonii TaxID=467808 RepID=A0ACA9Y0C1_9ASCO|nr:37S ribosomal protein S23, mitochondrial [[Candida] jaroonii]
MLKIWSRGISTSRVMSAPKHVGGKSKVKQGFKGNSSAKEKVKKSGMTHLKFKDAVRELKFEKFASKVELPILKSESTNGDVVKYSKTVKSKLEQLGSFKKYQHHEAFEEPISLVSNNLINLKTEFFKNFGKDSNKFILKGEHRVGKSTLLTQIQALSKTQFPQVLYLHFSDVGKIRDGSNDYIFNKRLGLYQQPMFTKRFINDFRIANKEVLKTIKLSKDIKFTANKVHYDYKAGENTLYEFLRNCKDFNLKEATSSFQFFIEELKATSVPKLITIDNFNAVTTKPITEYKTTDFEPTHVTEFEMGKFIYNLIDNTLVLPNSGILLSESSDYGKSRNLDIGLGADYNAYELNALDSITIETLLKGKINVFQVENFNKAETSKLLEFYNKCGVLQLRDYVYNQRLPTQVEQGIDLSQLIELNYVKSGGNPGLLFRHVALNY